MPNFINRLYRWRRGDKADIIKRLYVWHRDDKANPLIELKLCVPYDSVGVFKAGNSYVIRFKTKTGSRMLFDSLRRTENIIHDYPYILEPYSTAYGSYTISEHKKFYSDALGRYVNYLAKLGDDYLHIKNMEERIEYLTARLSELRPDDYKSILTVQSL